MAAPSPTIWQPNSHCLAAPHPHYLAALTPRQPLIPTIRQPNSHYLAAPLPQLGSPHLPLLLCSGAIWGGVSILRTTADPPVVPQSSPPSFCAPGRTQDLDAVLSIIDAAQQFISVAVMSYLPASEFQRPDRSWQGWG